MDAEGGLLRKIWRIYILRCRPFSWSFNLVLKAFEKEEVETTPKYLLIIKQLLDDDVSEPSQDGSLELLLY